MTYNTSWQRGHREIARKVWEKEKRLKTKSGFANDIPQLSTNYLEWIDQARPIVEGKQRSFLPFPFWKEIYMDNYSFKMIMGGRQIFKSTYITDILACEATSIPGVQVGYVTFSQQSQTSFSRQKLQIGTFNQNPILSRFPRHKTGNVGEISMRNGSTIYCTTHTNEYRNVEGKSLNHCILDEAQYQDMEYAQKVVQTMMATKGKLTIAGIGGESGSAYEKYWKNSDQREWVYDDPDWRNKLQFDQNGLIIGKYLLDVLRGRWIPRRPENTICHGYHLPQTIFPTIPLTMDDAMLYYKINPMYSIEYQKKNNSDSFFKTHVLGEFYRSTARPVTPEMVLACMNPYRHLDLSRPVEVFEFKDMYHDKIRVSMGVDFGSGSASSTVVAVLIEWRLYDGQKRLHLAYLEKRPAENQLDQAQYLCNLFKAYRCDIGIGDLGYGAIPVKIIQDGGSNRHTGEKFSGVSSDKFKGCRTISDETKPLQIFNETTDEHGDKTSSVSIDKTISIQQFIDMLGTYVFHPRSPDENLRRPKLIIPYKIDYHVDWLIDDFTNITRKDLAETENIVDPRQQAKKEFNHPRDSVMAIIYAMKALELDSNWSSFSV
jgi:hypothetical protein